MCDILTDLIKPGDELTDGKNVFVVLGTGVRDAVYLMMSDGSMGPFLKSDVLSPNVKKTGRYYPQIASVLQNLQKKEKRLMKKGD